MTRLPDPERSRAVFIGTSSYENESLEDLPAVEKSLKRLLEALANPTYGWVASNTSTSVLDAPHQVDIHDALKAQAQAATDTLLVYYAGHGLLNRQNELYLCPSTVRPDALGPTALAYQEVRDIVAASPAKRRIVILDCCFSGRAIPMSGEAIDPHLEIEGTYVLTATTRNQQALAPTGQPYTAFTGALIDLLTAGIPAGPELLTLAAIFPHLSASLASQEMPRPWQQGTGTIADLALIRNPAQTGPGGIPLRSPALSAPLSIVKCRHPTVRAAADAVLGRWLTDPDPAKVQTAHRTLLFMGADETSEDFTTSLDSAFYLDLEKQLQKIADVGVYFTNRERTIIYWNDGAEQLTGYKEKTVLGYKCWDNRLCHVDDAGRLLCEVSCPLLATIAGGDCREARVYLRHHDGYRQRVHAWIGPRYDERGDLIGAVQVFTKATKSPPVLGPHHQDSLTRLGNRTYLSDQLTSALYDLARFNRPFGVLVADIDCLEQMVNRPYGKDVGDATITMVARTLANSLRRCDVVVRSDGDEFVIVLKLEVPDSKVLRKVAERLRRLVATCRLHSPSPSSQVTISLGGTLAVSGDREQNLLARARTGLEGA